MDKENVNTWYINMPSLSFIVVKFLPVKAYLSSALASAKNLARFRNLLFQCISRFDYNYTQHNTYMYIMPSLYTKLSLPIFFSSVAGVKGLPPVFDLPSLTSHTNLALFHLPFCWICVFAILNANAVAVEPPELITIFIVLTLTLLNPDMSCLYKQCRSRSGGFWRS